MTGRKLQNYIKTYETEYYWRYQVGDIFFVPDSISTRTIKGVVYEVNLVELPAKRPSSSEGVTPPAKLVKSQSEAQKSVPTRRISRPKTEEKPVVIAKKTVKRPPQKVEKPKESPSKLIEEAISKLQKKVEAEKKDPLKQVLFHDLLLF